MESARRFKSLFWRVSGRPTGVHLAWKRSNLNQKMVRKMSTIGVISGARSTYFCKGVLDMLALNYAQQSSRS